MRILVLRLSSLGDIVLTQPVVQELRLLYPQAEIHYICKPQYACLPGLFGADIEVFPYSKSLGWHIGLLRKEYDICVDLHSKFSTLLISYLVKAKKTVVYNKQRKLRVSIIKGARSASIESTVGLYYSALMRLLPDKFKTGTEIKQPKLVIDIDSEGELPGAVERSDKKVIGLFIGAAHPTKAYPVQQWREFIKLLSDEYQVWLLGDGNDMATAKTIRESFTDIIDLTGKLELCRLIHIIGRCDVIISGDTGPMHLAAALEKKQITIFGSTHPRLGFAPLNANARVLYADLDCQPCSLHGAKRCPMGHFNCMKQISPELLFRTLQEILPT